MTKTLLILAAVVLLFLPAYGLAQRSAPQINVPIPSDPNAPIKAGGDFLRFIDRISQYFAFAFWIFAAASAFYAAYLYLFAGGNPEMLKRAQKQLWYTIIAIVIGLMAYGLPAFIKTLLEARLESRPFGPAAPYAPTVQPESPPYPSGSQDCHWDPEAGEICN